MATSNGLIIALAAGAGVAIVTGIVTLLPRGGEGGADVAVVMDEPVVADETVAAADDTAAEAAVAENAAAEVAVTEDAGTENAGTEDAGTEDAGADMAAEAVTAPSVETLRIEPDGNAVIAGRAAAGAIVAILIGDEVLGEAVADAEGQFVGLVSIAPSQEPRMLSLISDPAAAAVPSAETYLVAPFGAPEVEMASADTEEAAVAEAEVAVAEEAVAEETVAEAEVPVVDAADGEVVVALADEPVADLPVVEESVAVEAVTEEAVVEETMAEDTVAEVAVPDEAAEEAVAEDAAVADVAEPEAEIAVAEEAVVAEETPVIDEVAEVADVAQALDSTTEVTEPEAVTEAEIAAEVETDVAVADAVEAVEAQPVVAVLNPELAEPEAIEPAAPPVLVSDADGVRVMTPALAPGASPEVLRTVAVDAIAYDDEGGVDMTGRATGGGLVRVYVNNAPLSDVAVDENGQWSADLTELASGVYTLRIDQIGDDGKVMSRIETPFLREERDQIAAVMAEQTASEGFGVAVHTVQPGNTLWAIARDTYGDGVMYVSVFEANQDRIRNPDLIYPGQIFVLPAAEGAQTALE